VTATPTVTNTPTATPTRTPTGSGSIGQQCVLTSDCQGGLTCVDGVCCNSPCDGPGESCDLPNRVGFCSRPQIAPATSQTGQAVAAGVLIVLAWFGLRALWRRDERA